MDKDETVNKALELFDEGYACSQSILLTFAGLFKLDERTAKLISSTFGGGMGRLRNTCGAVTGGFMVLGLAYGNETSCLQESSGIGSFGKGDSWNDLMQRVASKTRNTSTG